MKAVAAAVERLAGSIMVRSTSMWTLCPSGAYKAAAEKYLSTPEMADIKAQTDKYYQAQLNARSNIKKLADSGVQVLCVAEYNMNLINVGTSWNSENADYIIQLDSTSMGAHAAKVGETLPADYVQQNTYCQNPEHNHISPDRVVDASTGLFPDTTFYVDNQRHDLTQHNNFVLELAMELIAHDDITDVYSSPKFPQFTSGRDVRVLHTAISQANAAITTGGLNSQQKAELEEAVAEAEAMLADTSKAAEDFAAAANKINALLVADGFIEPEEVKSAETATKISLWLYNNFGTNGYSEFLRVLLEKLFA